MSLLVSINKYKNINNCAASDLTAVLYIKSKMSSTSVHTFFSVCLQMNRNLINLHLVLQNEKQITINDS